MIDQPTIDRILDAAQIVDVVSDFVTLRKRGVNYVGLCPFHDDKTPSFYVSPASFTPLNCALNALILALNDSAAALVALLSKKLIIFG